MTRARDLAPDTAVRAAACGTLGLSYWANHPATGCMWAVDDNQRVHIVRMNKADRTAQHVCGSVGTPPYWDGPSAHRYYRPEGSIQPNNTGDVLVPTTTPFGCRNGEGWDGPTNPRAYGDPSAVAKATGCTRLDALAVLAPTLFDTCEVAA